MSEAASATEPQSSKAEVIRSEEEWTALNQQIAALEAKCLDRDALFQRAQKLEEDLEKLKREVALGVSGSNNKAGGDNQKKCNEEILKKAKGMLFEKEKTVQNQQRQIEAYNLQVSSLKEVVTITKDLLEIRNTEVASLQARMESLEIKVKNERERHQLVLKKFDLAGQINTQLKTEYETQLKIFKELRTKYEAKLEQLTKDNKSITDELEAAKKTIEDQNQRLAVQTSS